MIRPWVALIALGAVACAEPSPEQRLRETIRLATASAEEQDLSALAEFVAPDFVGPHGMDRPSLLAFVGLELRRHQSVHLFARVRELEWLGDGVARVVVWVAMAGEPIRSEQELFALEAEFARVELGMRDGPSGWQVVSADWRRVERADFF